MNRKILCGLVLLMTFFVACAAKKKGTKPKTTKNTTNITSIEIYRGVCFGRCPEYRLKLSSDGSAMYVGKKFATYQGTYEKKLNAGQVQELFQRYERYRVDTCQAKYPYMPDVPGLEYTIVYKGGKEQTIENANTFAAPRYLVGLAEEIDKLATVDATWKKTASWTEGQK